MNRTASRIALFALAALSLGLHACTTTMKTRSVEPSGFLGDISQLQEGGFGKAGLVYFDETAPWASYDKILLEPVQLYAAPGSKLEKLDPEQAKALLDYFDATLREHLGADYQFVDEAGPGTLRMRVALTEAKGAKVVLNVVSSVTWPGLALSTLKRVATGTHSAVAQTQAEMELLDAATGKRLAAAVDRRAGRKVTFRLDKFSRYAQVRDSFDYWAARMAERLEAARAGVAPR